jgi:hypothetical protein
VVAGEAAEDPDLVARRDGRRVGHLDREVGDPLPRVRDRVVDVRAGRGPDDRRVDVPAEHPQLALQGGAAGLVAGQGVRRPVAPGEPGLVEGDLDRGHHRVVDLTDEAEVEPAVGDRDAQLLDQRAVAADLGRDVEVVQAAGALGGDVEDPLPGPLARLGEVQADAVGAGRDGDAE